MLQFMFSVGGIRQTSFYVCNCQLREVFDDFIVVHSGSQPAQYVINGYPGISNTWFSKSFVRISFDDISIFNHGIKD